VNLLTSDLFFHSFHIILLGLLLLSLLVGMQVSTATALTTALIARHSTQCKPYPQPLPVFFETMKPGVLTLETRVFRVYIQALKQYNNHTVDAI